MKVAKTSLFKGLVVTSTILAAASALPALVKECRTESSFHPSEEIELVCDTNRFPDTLKECVKLIEDLDNNPTHLSPQQLYDLQFALFKVSLFDLNFGPIEDIQQKLLTTIRQLSQDYPNDASVNLDAAAVEYAYGDDERYLRHARNVVILVPSCLPNLSLLASFLEDRSLEIGDSSVDDITAIIAERNQVLELGYTHAATNEQQLIFGGKRYIAYLREDQPVIGAQWRANVIKDIEPLLLPVDEINIDETATLMCYELGHNLGLAEYCLAVLERAVIHALTQNEPVSDFVLIGAKDLMHGLTGFKGKPLNPERVKDRPYRNQSIVQLYGPNDVAYIGPRLREVLELVPLDQQDIEFYDAYRYVIGERTRIRWLRDMSRRNPDDEWVREELRTTTIDH